MLWQEIATNAHLDWDQIAKLIPQSDSMKSCVQDAVFHAEGDVWTHTQMVTEHLQASHDFVAMPHNRQQVLLIAAILHDVAKPATRRVVFDDDLGRDRVTHHGHSRMGARDAWVILWRAGVPLDVRMDVYALIEAHQRPFHVFKKRDPRLDLARFSAVGSWRELLTLARADNRGRVSPNSADTVEALNLLEAMCEEEGVLESEWPFGNAAQRTNCVRGNGDGLFFTPQEPAGSRVTILSGIPGSGKDTYAQRRLGDVPVVSFDTTRGDMRVDWEGNQGRVVQATFEQAKKMLRRKEPFIWNAVGITRMMRDKIASLSLQYDAHVAIHAIDCPPILADKRNRARREPVSDEVIERMLLKWEPPMPGEAHDLIWIDAESFEPIPMTTRSVVVGPPKP